MKHIDKLTVSELKLSVADLKRLNECCECLDYLDLSEKESNAYAIAFWVALVAVLALFSIALSCLI